MDAMSAHDTVPAYPCQIVIAWVDDEAEVVPDPSRRVDLGERPILRPCKVAKAARWVNAGGPDDMASAERHAAREGYTALAFPPDVKDALAAARAEVLRRAGEQ